MQGDPFNRSRLATVVVIPLTSNLRLAEMPGNLRLSVGAGRFAKESVANVSQIVAVDRALLTERVGKVSPGSLQRILAGLDLVLDRR